MARRSERRPIGGGPTGSERSLLIHRYGPPQGQGKGGPKAYLQAAIHADEIPAMLAAHHLVRRLDAADARGEITGRIVLVPYANPIGLSQIVNRRHNGRFELAGGGNFNRNWPDLFVSVAAKVAGRLTAEESENVATIRAALHETVSEMPEVSELERLRRILASEACDSDLLLDLHCDDEALMHLYLMADHWPDGEDIAAELGCHAVLLADDSGGGAFDECFAIVWTKLARRFPDHPIPAACLGGTVELRGQPDVSDQLAEKDADALFRILQHRGFVAGDPGAPPAPLCEATRLEACDVVRAPAAGVLSYQVALGARVRAGDTIAWLIDPAAEDPEQGRRPIPARNDGLILNRRVHKYVVPGSAVAKVVGSEPLDWRAPGKLLSE